MSISVFAMFALKSGEEVELQGRLVEEVEAEPFTERQLDPERDSSALEREFTAKEATDLLLDEAENQNIEVSNEDVDDYIQQSLDAYQMSKEELRETLDSVGISYERYKEGVKSQLQIGKLLNEIDLDSVEVSNEEVDDFIRFNEVEYQEFFDDDELLGVLRGRVKSKLLRDKQSGLVMDYLEDLR